MGGDLTGMKGNSGRRVTEGEGGKASQPAGEQGRRVGRRLEDTSE